MSERPFRQDDVIEFGVKDSWAATRYGLIPRRYVNAPARSGLRRFRLETLSEPQLRLFKSFLEEHGIEHRILSRSEARERPDSRQSG